MILMFLIHAIFSLIGIVLLLLPSINLPVPDFSGFGSILGYVNYFLPMGTLATIFKIFITYRVFIFGFNLFQFIIKKVPFVK